MIVFVGGNHKQRILWCNPILCKAAEELAEGLIVSDELLDIAGLPRAERDIVYVIIVRVGNIAIDHRHACLEHRRHIAQSLRRRWVEAREALIAAAVLDDVAVDVLDRPLRGNLWLDEFIAE